MPSKSERIRMQTRKSRIKSWLVRIFDPDEKGYKTLKGGIKTKINIMDSFSTQQAKVEKALITKLKSKGYKPTKFLHMIGYVDVKKIKKR